MTQTAKPLRLAALDADDLSVIAAALQDALTRPDDIRYDAKRRELTVAFSRLRHELKSRGPLTRCRSVLHLADVMAVRARSISDLDVDGFLSLLTIDIAEDEKQSPAAELQLIFADDRALSISVEAIDARLMDTQTEWLTSRTPRHNDEG